MPEIAEVRTVRDVLRKQILNKKIIEVKIIYPNMLESNANEFQSILIGNEFSDVKAYGKWLFLELKEHTLLTHLRMEGKFFIKNHNAPIEKHEHIIITFEDNTDLRYHDTRKFGKMNLVKTSEVKNVPAIAKQGYEPNDKNLTAEYLLSKYRNKSLPIKSILLDQTIISGLGNIYANEVLFSSKINPLKKGKDITIKECTDIIDSSRIITDEAIKLGGTTIKSYTSSLGVEGKYQNKLMVHKKEGEPCKTCGNPIKNIKVNGRSTYFCDICQK